MRALLHRLGLACWHFARRVDFFPLSPSFTYHPFRLSEWARRDDGVATLYKYTLGLVWLLFALVPAVPCVLIVTRLNVNLSEFLMLAAAVVLVRPLIPLIAAMGRDIATLGHLTKMLTDHPDTTAFSLSDLFGDRLDGVSLASAPITRMRYTLLFTPAIRSFTAYQIAPHESVIFLNDRPADMNPQQKFTLAHELSHIGWANYMQAGSQRWLYWHSVLASASLLSFVNFGPSVGFWLGIANSLLLALVFAMNMAIFQFGRLHAEVEADYGSLEVFVQLARAGDADALSPLSPIGKGTATPPEDRAFQDTLWDDFARSQNTAVSWTFRKLVGWVDPMRAIADRRMSEGDISMWERTRWNPNFEFRPALFTQMRDDARQGNLRPLRHYLAQLYGFNLLAGWINVLILTLLCFVLPLVAATSYLASASFLVTYLLFAVICYLWRWRRKRRLTTLLRRQNSSPVFRYSNGPMSG